MFSDRTDSHDSLPPFQFFFFLMNLNKRKADLHFACAIRTYGRPGIIGTGFFPSLLFGIGSVKMAGWKSKDRAAKVSRKTHQNFAFIHWPET